MVETDSICIPDRLNPCSGWWAVYTRHQHEKAVANMLVAKGLKVFLPLYESLRHWKERKKKLLMPLFPGYLFVRECLGGPLQIVTVPGTNMILARGEHLEIISDDEIQTIWRATVDPSNIEPHPFLNSGERVRVTCGALQGIEGILVRKKSPVSASAHSRDACPVSVYRGGCQERRARAVLFASFHQCSLCFDPAAGALYQLGILTH